MSKFILNVLFGLCLSAALAQGSTTIQPHGRAMNGNAYADLPLYFIRNQGQLDRRIHYYEQGGGHNTYFTRDGIYLDLRGDADKTVSTQLIRLSPLNGNPKPNIVAEQQRTAKFNYFRGKDPKQWQTGIPSFGVIVYRDIYRGIDLRIYGNNRELEYDVIVEPGADPSVVRFSYTGPRELQVNDQGELVILLEDGSILQRRPVLFQEIEGQRIAVEGAFRIEQGIAGKTDQSQQLVYGFDIGSYNKDYPLVIDPVLVYSTYLGGSSNDYAYDVGVDGAGNSYVAGFTQSSNFPLASPYQGGYAGNDDGFISKFDPTGTMLLYSTYLGGSSTDQIFGLAVDTAGNAYVTGMTTSTNFPMANPYQGSFAGVIDGFVTKLDPTGSALVYSTYIGGSDFERPEAIAVDGSGNVAITGYTTSTDYALQAPIQATPGGSRDAFVTKFTADGSALVHSTYLGGSLYDIGYGITMDGAGNTYVTGYTKSADYPTVAPYQAALGGVQDAFVAKYLADGSALSYSTYFGGGSDDFGHSIVADVAGNAYLTGFTESADFPTIAPFQGVKAFDGDAFVSRFNPTGSTLDYSTFLGGNGWESGHDIALDTDGRICVVGLTRSTDFPLHQPAQLEHMGLEDAFVTMFEPAGAALVYSTYLGSTGNDSAEGIAADATGDVYVAGRTQDVFVDFPLVTPFQPVHGGGIDAFVTRLNDATLAPDITVTDSVAPFNDLAIDFGAVPVGQTATATVTLTNDGGADLQVQQIQNLWLLVPPFSMVDDPCSWQVLAPGESCVLTVAFTPTETGERINLFDIRSEDPVDPFILFELTGAGVASQDPLPDIKANGSDGPVQIGIGSPLLVEVSLNPNAAAGQAADWWVVAEAPDGLYWYSLSGNWVKSASPIATYRGNLMVLPPMPVLNNNTLPQGSYRFNFGVDTVANGRLDFGALYLDTVDVTIQ